MWVTLKAAAGGSRIKIWESPTRGTEVILPKTYRVSDLPKGLYVEGISASSSLRDITLTLEYSIRSQTFEDKIKATVYKAELKSIKFTSDHGLLKDNNTDWEDLGTTYIEPEWIPDGPDPGTEPDRNNPISHTKNVKLTVDVTVKVEPWGLTFDIIGDGSSNDVDFIKTGLTSTGSDQVVTITANENLPNQVTTLTKSINWKIKLLNPNPDIEKDVGTSGPHKIYVVYGTPSGSVVTEKRMSWACEKANGQSTESGVADAIHDAVGDIDPPYEPGEKPSLGWGWPLLEEGEGATYGECDEQAGLMELAVETLGISGNVRLVRASTNAGAGNCLDYESRTLECPVHGPEKLLLDFYGGGTPENMNQFEGCCETAGNYYAVWPKEKATNDYTMLQTLGSRGVTQHYCWWDYTIGWWRPCDQPGSTPGIP